MTAVQKHYALHRIAQQLCTCQPVQFMVKANSLVQQNRRIGFHGLIHTHRDGSALSKWKTHISARTVQGQ